MARNRIWLLNFDADDELANPSGYHPSRGVLARFAALETRVSALLAPGDELLNIASNQAREAVDAARFEGRAWCPTPRAVNAWRELGACAPRVPTVGVLRRVNHRRFSAEIGQTLPGARFVTDRDELVRVIAAATKTGHWLVKRPFGFAGRGRRRMRAGSLDDSARGWIDASFAHGDGLQIEPWVERAGDFGLHGFVSATGTVTLGATTMQRLDANGAWQGTERADDSALAPAERTALFDAAMQTAHAVASAGYFGPFGIDAFRWIDADGRYQFNPRCEINARYSMGWAIGMGANRPDLDE